MGDWLGLGKVHDIILYFGLVDTTRQGFWDKGIDLNPISESLFAIHMSIFGTSLEWATELFAMSFFTSKSYLEL